MRTSNILSGVAIGVVITTVTFLSFSIRTQKTDVVEQDTDPRYAVPERPVFTIGVDVAKRIDFEHRVSATGRARARREAPVVPQISGLVQEVLVREGMRVEKDQVLFIIDDREFVIALREAQDHLLDRQIEYNLMKAGPTPDPAADPPLKDLLHELEKQFQQSKEAFAKNEITEREFTLIRREYQTMLTSLQARREEVIANKSGLAQAERQYERAQLNLAHTRVRAPFAGYIANFDIEEGMIAQTGREYLKVVDLFTMHIEVGIIESELPSIRQGARAYVRFPALGDRRFEGRVITISPYIHPETRTARVTVSVPNPEGVIKAGMFAHVEIVTDEIRNALVVPRDALLVRDQRQLVFRIENNVAKWHYVTTGRRNPDYIQILQGISPGDTIAVSGHYTLAHDARVRIH